MTGTEAKTMIFTLMGEDPSTPIHFSESQVEYWMLATMNAAAEKTRYLEGRWDLALAAESALVLSDNVIQVERVETDNDGRMRPVTSQELWRSNRFWRSQTGTPRFYYLDTQREAAVGSGAQVLRFYPLHTAQLNYRLYFSSYPTDPADDASAEMEIPTWCAHLVVYGTLARAYRSIGTRTSLAASAFYQMMHDALVRRLRVRANTRLPKRWVAGAGTHRRLSGHELFPQNIPEPS